MEFWVCPDGKQGTVGCLVARVVWRGYLHNPMTWEEDFFYDILNDELFEIGIDVKHTHLLFPPALLPPQCYSPLPVCLCLCLCHSLCCIDWMGYRLSGYFAHDKLIWQDSLI